MNKEDEITKKTYNEIISELESFDLLRKFILGLSTMQLIIICLMIRTEGLTEIIMPFYVLTIAFFIIPLFIELAMKKANKYIS